MSMKFLSQKVAALPPTSASNEEKLYTITGTFLKLTLFGGGGGGSHCDLTTGKYGCRKVHVYPAECGQQLARDPSTSGSSKSLVLRSFAGKGRLRDSSLLVSLTLWDTPVVCASPLPLSQLMETRLCEPPNQGVSQLHGLSHLPRSTLHCATKGCTRRALYSAKGRISEL